MSSFWDFPACAKWDELKEPNHTDLILCSLADDLTNVDQVDAHTFIIYGPEEALLFRPVSLVFKHSMLLYSAMVSLISSIQRY